MDLDQFRDFNRVLGRRAGDRLFHSVVQAVVDRLPTPSLLARYGGDELAVLLPGAESAGAGALAAELRQAIRSIPCALRPITASLGVATDRPPDARTEDLIGAAARAMATASAAGGDRVVGAVRTT